MPDEFIQDKKLTQNNFNDLVSPFVLDMTAFFNLLQQAVEDKIVEAENNGWPVDQLIDEVSNLI